MKKITKISILSSTIGIAVISIPIVIKINNNNIVNNNNSKHFFHNYSTTHVKGKSLKDINTLETTKKIENKKIFKTSDLAIEIFNKLADPQNKAFLEKNYKNDELEATNDILGLDPKYFRVPAYQLLHNGSNLIRVLTTELATFEDGSQTAYIKVEIKDRFFKLIENPRYKGEFFNKTNTRLAITNQLLGISGDFYVEQNTWANWGDNIIKLIAKSGFMFSNRKEYILVNIKVFKNKPEDIKKEVEDIKKLFDNIKIINQSKLFVSDIAIQFNNAIGVPEKIKLLKKWFGIDVPIVTNDTKIIDITGAGKKTGELTLTIYTYSENTPALNTNNHFEVKTLGVNNTEIADIIQIADALRFKNYFDNAVITAEAQGYRLISDIAKTIVDADSLYLLLGKKNVPKFTSSFLSSFNTSVNKYNNNLQIKVIMTTPFATDPTKNIFINSFKPNKLDSDINNIPVPQINEARNEDINNINKHLENQTPKLMSENADITKHITDVSSLKTWAGIDLNIYLKSSIINKIKAHSNSEGDLIIDIYLKTNITTDAAPSIQKVFKKVFEKSIVIDNGETLSLKWIIVISVFGASIVGIGIVLLLLRLRRYKL
ncbi:MAG: hypothetical protein GY679_03275 [Mycoplasma sp.]|nr:hypothetical protein [Mycoplasma sp.]